MVFHLLPRDKVVVPACLALLVGLFVAVAPGRPLASLDAAVLSWLGRQLHGPVGDALTQVYRISGVGFTAILGTLGLIGLAINDSIVVLNAIRTDPLAAVGDPAATTAVVLHATRHVIATTLTTVTGFLPLMLDPTGFWPPLAIAVSGGLVGATALPCCPLHRPPWNDQHG